MDETINSDSLMEGIWNLLYPQEEDAKAQTPDPKTAEEEAEDVSTPPPYQTIIDVYVVTHGAEEAAETVEGSLARGESAPPVAEREAEQAAAASPSKAAPPISARGGRPMRWLVPTALLLLAALALLGGGLLALWSQLGPSVTITLLPSMQQVRTRTTITVVTTPSAHLGQQQIPGRILSTLTLSQQTSVPTTGTRWQEAQAARGRITFYNAATFPQTITAGTLLTGTDGVQVVTEQDTFLPAAVLPTDGQASVWAHAVSIGPSGNIGAGDIYGACCRENVFAQNSAFTGGQNARLLRVVSAQDWQRALSSLKTSLQASIQAAFGAQVQSGESLLEPVACTPTVIATHQIGEEASQLQMTLDEQCHGTVYQTQAFMTLASQAVTAAAKKQIGGQGYRRIGDLAVRITKSTPGAQGTLTLAMQVSGTWAYQFSELQMQHLTQVIAGKSAPAARTLLLQQAGVAQVEMNTDGSTTLPTDPDHIHLLVIEAGS